MYDMLDNLLIIDPSVLSATPLLAGLHKRISERPNIASYLKSDARPKKVNNSGRGSPK